MDYSSVVEFNHELPPGADPSLLLHSHHFSETGLLPGQDYQCLNQILVDGGDRFGVSAVCFDSHEELLWNGNQAGHVTSYYTYELQKYTSFQVHATNEVRKLVTIPEGVVSITDKSVRLNIRRGLIGFHQNSEKFVDLHCICQSPSGTILVGGNQDSILEMDISRGGEIVRSLLVGEQGTAVIRRHPRFVCTADFTGNIFLRNPQSLEVEHKLDTFGGVLSDFDVHGNMVVTCACVQRPGGLSPEMFLKVYDLRQMRAVAPIQLMFPPSFLKFVPVFTTKLWAASQTGQFQLVDTSLPHQDSFVYQVPSTSGSPFLSFDVSSSCQALAFGDMAGSLWLYGSSPHVTFNNFSNPTEFATPIEPLPHMDVLDPLTILASIPMPFCTERLLSDLPPDMIKYSYHRTPSIDPVILQTMKMVGNIGYAPNPGKWKRNQIPHPSLIEAHSKKTSPEETQKIPQWYHKIEIKYSKLGIDDFDFNMYNRTCFAGLEMNLPNAYCNNMIQVLYFIEPLRRALKAHICQREFCLACELGFLFHMFDTSQGLPCQASNFLRAFRTIPEASALNLLLPDNDEVLKKINYARLIQNWMRFLLQQISIETQVTKADKSVETDVALVQSIVRDLFAFNFRHDYKCRCGNVIQKQAVSMVCPIVYPEPPPPAADKKVQRTSFTRLLQRSLSLETSMPTWCEKCEKFQPTIKSQRIVGTLPHILTFSCGLDNQQDLNFWRIQVNDTVEKMVKTRVPGGLSAAIPKRCRFGSACNRIGCRFFHDSEKDNRTDESIGEETVSEKSGSSDSDISWLPSRIKVCLRSDGSVLVSRDDNETVKAAGQSGENNNENSSKESSPDSGGAETNELAADKEVISESEKKDSPTTEKPVEAKAEKELDSEDEVKESMVFELTAVVVAIKMPRNNIVSFIRVSPLYHQRQQRSENTQWYLFNDYAIVPVSEKEVTNLALDWKIPGVLFYSRVDLLDKHEDLEEKCPLSDDIFLQDKSLVKRGIHVTFTPLSQDEILNKGDIVGMDAEFVTLNQEEAEIRSDGTRSTIRPSQMSVARISCLRGQGPMAEVPFIDDYISTQEQVVDYLTQFSGIQPGDLDVTVSSKHLTTLKSTYLKLRCLVDKGVVFVGHGLKNDFRVINLVVPSEQVIDTVLLFQLPNKRMVSLRFLAWHFLGIKIQAETHDSIEDAKTALKLYRKYEELKESGSVNDALKEMYDAGRLLQWKVPGADD